MAGHLAARVPRVAAPAQGGGHDPGREDVSEDARYVSRDTKKILFNNELHDCEDACMGEGIIGMV